MLSKTIHNLQRFHLVRNRITVNLCYYAPKEFSRFRCVRNLTVCPEPGSNNDALPFYFRNFKGEVMKRISFAALAVALILCVGAFDDAQAQFGRTMPKISEAARISSSDASSEGRMPEASGSVILSQVYGGGG